LLRRSDSVTTKHFTKTRILSRKMHKL